VFLTSASVAREVVDKAGDKGIAAIDGMGLVDWIAEHIHQLSTRTKRSLGICEAPSTI